MSDLSIFKLDTQTINIKDTTAREAADSAKNKINELESEKADAIISSTSGAIASFQDGAESTAKELVVAIEPVQEGTGDPSPENVRPISGWTGAKVTRTGKNLFRLGVSAKTISVNGITVTPNSDNTITVNGTNTGNNLNVHLDFGSWGNTPLLLKKRDADYRITYFIKINGTISGKYIFFGGYIDKNGDPHQSDPVDITSSTHIKTITISKDATRLRTWLNIQNNGSASNAIIEIQAELGSTATDYEPYQGSTYPITFPTEAGTVYGGSLDVTTGVLTVDRAQIASYNGETLPGKWISDRDVYAEGASPTTGAQVVYELSTPVTYQLTPQEITTLLGQNNIWADTGDTSVTYRADTKLYIDKKFTELQALILEKGETDYDSTTKENMTITTDTHSVA